MHILAEQYFAVAFIVVGLSHVLQPKLWLEFFSALNRTGFAGLVIALYTLPQGLFLLTVHNEWSWTPSVILTVAGWGMTIKSCLYLLFPKLSSAVLQENPLAHRGFSAAGIALIAMGAALSIKAFQTTIAG